jgi:DMSO/TMAO reductase YedYZ heme-binding membrane subunit
MIKLIPYIRKIVFAITAIIIGLVFFSSSQHEGGLANQTHQLAQGFAHLAYAYLLAALFASPLYIAFPKLPGKALYVKARKAIGVSVFFFAALHVYYAFFSILGGFPVLPYLPPSYLVATTLGAVSLLILSVMAVTSHKYFVKKLGRHWKPVHRFVYLVAIAIPIHALIIGPNFQQTKSLVAAALLVASVVLLALEEYRLYNYILKKYPRVSPPVLLIILVFVFVGALLAATVI